MARKSKPELASVHFTGIADKGMAVGRTEDGRVVFCKGPLPGEKVEILLTKKQKGVFQGVVKNYLEYSPERIPAFCTHFDLCGGCKWQHLKYESQLREKEIQVRDAFKRIAKMEPGQFLPVRGCELTTVYRNKLEFSFSSKKWLTAADMALKDNLGEQDALGFHAPGSFDKIVQIDHCHLQPEPSNEIRNFIRKFTKENAYSYWDAKTHTGMMRNLVIRTASTGETMVVIVFSKNDPERIEALLNAVKQKFPALTSLQYVINTKFNDSLSDQEFILYDGKPEITEKLGELKFLISPKSFFQTNTLQTRVLYDIALDFAGLKGDEKVFDLYTGLGSIALYIAGKAGHVTGIELIEEAILDAKKNAALNEIENVRFIAGDVKDEIRLLDSKPDLVFVDPPRSGLHPEVIDSIMELEPQKIIYISCNPATQARDAALFSDKYYLEKVQPVDMFPHTHHIECVASMVLKV